MVRWVCPSACPVVRRTPFSALYSTHESMDGIYYVNGMLARLVVCITALVGTWSTLNRVNMGYGTVGVSVGLSAPFSALYSSHESMDGIHYVNGMLARLVVCITALVGTWSTLNRVYMGMVQWVCPSTCPHNLFCLVQ